MSSEPSLAGVGPFGGTSLAEVGARLRNREISAEELTEQALASAHLHNPSLNCFVTIDDEGALRAARQADRELEAGLDRGPLHGMPVGVKDMIATSGLRTTMGSRHFSDHVPVIDADVVTSLRQSGAVVLGKTQTHEFAYGPTSDRAATGPARNPHDTQRMTGGSSGGSGAAVAAGLVPVALGTDTGGSARIPAALCGTVGMRPTQGALPSRGAFPLSPTMDVVGPLAGSVADLAASWWALSAGSDLAGARLPRWKEWTARPPVEVAAVRIASVDSALTQRAGQRSRAAAGLALNALGQSGAASRVVGLPEIDQSARLYGLIQSGEAYAIHAQRVSEHPELFEPEVLERLTAASEVSGWEYVRALEERLKLRASVLERLTTTDILVMPTVPIEAPLVDQRELSGEGEWSGVREALLSMTLPWSLLGFPALSVPVPSTDSHLPDSVQLIAKPGQERLLMDVAAALESQLRAD